MRPGHRGDDDLAPGRRRARRPGRRRCRVSQGGAGRGGAAGDARSPGWAPTTRWPRRWSMPTAGRAAREVGGLRAAACRRPRAAVPLTGCSADGQVTRAFAARGLGALSYEPASAALAALALDERSAGRAGAGGPRLARWAAANAATLAKTSRSPRRRDAAVRGGDGPRADRGACGHRRAARPRLGALAQPALGRARGAGPPRAGHVPRAISGRRRPALVGARRWRRPSARSAPIVPPPG